MKSDSSKNKITEILISAPTLSWLTVFFLIPTIMAIIMALRPSNPYGDLLPGWTLENFKTIFSPIYISVVWRTIWVSILSTIICLLFSVPVGYYMARLSEKFRKIILFLVIVPFWTNFLIRIFAWKLILNPDGLIHKTFVFLGIIPSGGSLIYNTGTVILVIIYTYLPFAILPIFAAAERFDFKLLEAARDLGATRWLAFLHIFIPNISKGLMAAAAMVLIPCLGSYVIPDLVGGTNSQMVGNLIANQAFVARNIPMAAAWSTLLMAMILLPLGLILCVKILLDKNKD
ncbi:MAG TPA: spermidine/putrescine ABC transporter permease [Lentisphaeria bacterium]|nr:MAG: spermidine/putrescine ABC transporter permease [Lentisphaerae bacterium GWF2_38_69]HBM15684.1 spermidine/putrescine ABC transporter permease [Lentisphaeria bacterium]